MPSCYCSVLVSMSEQSLRYPWSHIPTRSCRRNPTCAIRCEMSDLLIRTCFFLEPAECGNAGPCSKWTFQLLRRYLLGLEDGGVQVARVVAERLGDMKYKILLSSCCKGRVRFCPRRSYCDRV